MADHDPLTGLLNRRSFERELTAHVARSGALRRGGRAAHARHRPLQVRERHARPQRGRRDHRAGGPGAAQRACASPTWWRASAATSSRCCCPRPTRRRARGGGQPARGGARPERQRQQARLAWPVGERGRCDGHRRRRAHRRGPPRERRPGDVRRQGGRPRPDGRLLRRGAQRGAHEGPRDLGAAHPVRARGRPLLAARPADRRPVHRARRPVRAAPADAQRERRPDPAGRVPVHRRAARPGAGHRPLGGGQGDRHARRARAGGQAAHARGQPVGALDRRRRPAVVHRGPARPTPASTPPA